MSHPRRSLATLGRALAAGLYLAITAVGAASQAPSRPTLRLLSGQVTIAGTSNVHPYTASTTDVRVVRAQLAPSVSGPSDWDDVLTPGVLEGFPTGSFSADLLGRHPFR